MLLQLSSKIAVNKQLYFLILLFEDKITENSPSISSKIGISLISLVSIRFFNCSVCNNELSQKRIFIIRISFLFSLFVKSFLISDITINVLPD